MPYVCAAPVSFSLPYMHALYVCLMCTQLLSHFFCLICMSCMCALCVHSSCLIFFALYVCLVCVPYVCIAPVSFFLPYMYALYVCLMCAQLLSRFSFCECVYFACDLLIPASVQLIFFVFISSFSFFGFFVVISSFSFLKKKENRTGAKNIFFFVFISPCSVFFFCWGRLRVYPCIHACARSMQREQILYRQNTFYTERTHSI